MLSMERSSKQKVWKTLSYNNIRTLKKYFRFFSLRYAFNPFYAFRRYVRASGVRQYCCFCCCCFNFSFIMTCKSLILSIPQTILLNTSFPPSLYLNLLILLFLHFFYPTQIKTHLIHLSTSNPYTDTDTPIRHILQRVRGNEWRKERKKVNFNYLLPRPRSPPIYREGILSTVKYNLIEYKIAQLIKSKYLRSSQVRWWGRWSNKR